jgi:hypothetical protein
MKKTMYLLLCLTIAAGLAACSDEEESGNDPRVLGRWEGVAGPGSMGVSTVTDGAFEYVLFQTNSDGMLEIGPNSNKGSYTAKDGNFVSTITHTWSDDDENWRTPESGFQTVITQAYVLTGSGVGAVLQMTNAADYVVNPSLNGTWSNQMPGSGGHEIWLLHFSSGTAFTMTQIRTSYGNYTNVTSEVDTGTTLFSSTGTSGWLESTMTTQQEWTAEGSTTLGPIEDIYFKSRQQFELTGGGTTLVINDGMMTLYKM